MAPFRTTNVRPPRPPLPAASGREGGFALIVSLSLMAVVMLAVVLLAGQVRLGIAGSSSETDRIRAKESARLGMAMAFGQLQRIAGGDRRATARAEILGGVDSDSPQALWTGVWSGENPGEAPKWLVSGDNPSPEVSTEGETFPIFPATPDRTSVQVPIEEVRENGSLIAKIAWFSSGEASKASLSGGRSGFSLYGQSSDFSDLRRVSEYATSFGFNLNAIWSGVEVGGEDDLLAEKLSRLNSTDEVLFVNDTNGGQMADADSLLDVIYDVTAFSFGVLEDPGNGGLKKNLSDPDFRDSFLANDDLAEFLGPKEDYLEVESTVPDRRSFAGKPFFSPRPLLSEAVLYVGLFHTWSDAKVRVRYHLESEFWNPYSLPLRFPRDSDSRYDRGAVLYFENLPTVTVTAEDLNVPEGWAVPDLEEDLNNFSSYSTGDHRKFLNSWVDILPTTDSGGQPELLPGEVYRVMEPNPATQPRGLARDFDTVRWSGNQQSRPDDDANIRITAVHPSDGVSLTVVPFHPNNRTIRSRDPFQKFENLVFDDFEIVKTFRNGPNPFSRATSTSYEIQDYVFAYHFRVHTDETDVSSMRDIQTAVDLRDPVFRGTDSYEDIDGVERLKGELLEPIYTDPSFVVQDDANLFSLQDQITDGTVENLAAPFSRSHEHGFRRMVLYDVPDGDALSVGQLSSVHIFRRNPRSIGNEWGGELNAAFDRYFLSPKLPDSGGAGRGVLASPWLTSANAPDIDADEDDAATELVDGSFNINSQSRIAWRAVLSSPALTPRGEDEGRGRGDVYRENGVFRLPGYQAEVGDFYLGADALQNPKRPFAQGIRVLEDGQIDDIVVSLLDAMQSRGEPFFSLEDFVNSGILASAIKDSGSRADSIGNPVNDGIMQHSNVFLEQADILTKIAPVATVRSDTFRIRVFGEAFDPRTGESVSSAICEAVVQRVPEKLDGSDPIDPVMGLTDLRKFRLLDFRWMDANES